MHTFSDPHISLAALENVPALTNLLNAAYRGESSKLGWTTEAHLISGNTRTVDSEVEHILRRPGSCFLKYTNEENEIVGCVNLQRHGNKIYFGMFSVSPTLQGAGIGKKLLYASEEYAKQLGCNSIYMTVISVRYELIKWYERHGYKDTGERKPFIEDSVSGKHLQQLEFMTLEKSISH
jgi:ribosomal protein S18 acetylase RimI-like enzyme